MKLSVLIVNWNGAHHLPGCLGSLAAQTFRDFEVILVDNGSTDSSVDLVRKDFPWVKVVELSENAGFATGNNIGLSHAVGDYIVAVNNDTVADSRWLEELVSVAEAHPRAGMVGCRICSFDDPDIIDSLGHGVCVDGMSRGRYRLARFSSLAVNNPMEIFFPSACAALYRREMLDEIGFFDDDFFAYAEDTDLGLRGRLAGWDAVLAVNAIIRHKYSETGGKFSPLKIYLVERNHFWVAFKTLPLRYLILLPITTLLRYAVQFAAVARGSGAGGEFRAGNRGEIVAALLRGIRDGLAGLPRMMAKRREIMSRKSRSTPDFIDLLKRYRLSFRDLLDLNAPGEAK